MVRTVALVQESPELPTPSPVSIWRSKEEKGKKRIKKVDNRRS